MRTQKRHWSMRVTALTAMLTTGGLPLAFTGAQAEKIKQRNALIHPPIVRTLAPGLTQTPDAATRKKIDAKEAAAHRAPDVRSLSFTEMKAAHGRGPNRNPYYGGSLPWHRNIHDVDLCTGNLFKSFTDVQVSPARGAGLVLQRTYNSNDGRMGPFGVGWTHAYDIRIEEAGGNLVPRTDFFGAKHTYHRDADGLYSPPPYLYDELDSNYNAAIVNGPFNINDDIDKGMDGTVKHFIPNGNERVCDYIQDRYGNTTTLAYNQTVTLGDGSTKKLLTGVTDPSGRTLVFTWINLGAAGSPAWRIARVDGPQYSVAYAYYTDINNADSLYNLASVTLDSGDAMAGHLNRTTTFTYTHTPTGAEASLLASITDPLGHAFTYDYTITRCSSAIPTPNVWVAHFSEPANAGTGAVSRIFTILPGNGPNPSGEFQDNAGLTYFCWMDGALRVNVQGLGNSAQTYTCSYDSANNVVTSQAGPAGFSSFYNNWGPGTQGDNGGPNVGTDAVYGPHGNVLYQSAEGFYNAQAALPNGETSSTAYFDGSQYFQKKSVTDALSHKGSMDVGANTAGTAGDPDPNPGDRGSVLSARDPGYSDNASPSFLKQTNYAYNGFGQKIKETNAKGVVTTYTYGDQWGNLTKVAQDPTPSPTDGQTHLNRTTTMGYDMVGHVLSSTDPAGRTSAFTYNNLGQPMTAFSPATANTAAETITYGYGGNGRTESVIDNRGTTTLAYWPGTDEVQTVTNPVTGSITYTYLLNGARHTMAMTAPSGNNAPVATWTYGYLSSNTESKDDANSVAPMLSTITDDQGRVVEYHFDILGTLHEVVSNQVYQSTTRVGYCDTVYKLDVSTTDTSRSHRRPIRVQNTWNWMNPQLQRQGQNLLVQNDYTYDLVGQRLHNQISGAVTNATGGPVFNADGSQQTTTRTEVYGYDSLNRLQNVDYGDGQTQSYTFDPMGNRMSKTDVGGGINGLEAYTYNAANMLLSRGSNAYTNDADGNTLTGGGRTNTWDSQNRLVTCVNGATTSSFVYGCDGIRHRSTVVNGASTTVTDSVLDNSMLVREQRAGSNFATYLVGARGPEYRRDDTRIDASSGLLGVTSWYLYDGLGSVLGEVDPNGNITSSRKYDVYGLPRGGNNPAGTSAQKFVGSLGHTSEDNTGLIYMRARYMDPQVGRFASEDPAVYGSNWYIYGDNAPTNSVDSSGKLPLAGGISAFCFLFFLCLTVAAGVIDPEDGTNLKIYIKVGQGLAGAVATISGLWALLSHTKDAPGQGTFEKRRNEIEDKLDYDKSSTGPNSSFQKLGAAMTEQVLWLITCDHDSEY